MIYGNTRFGTIRYGVNSSLSAIADGLGREVPGDYRASERDVLTFAMLEGEVIAMVVWCEWDGAAFIGQAWVREDLRRRGYYRALLARIEVEAQIRNLTCLRAAIGDDNRLSHSAHGALGFARKVVLVERPL